MGREGDGGGWGDKSILPRRIRRGLEHELCERGLEHELREITRKARKGFEVFELFREVCGPMGYFEVSP
jgi:hypothetical protein